jgi:transposase
MNLNVIGIDIGKNGCHFVGLDQSGQIVLRRRLSRIQLLRLLANMPKALIGMEACCGAHALARSLTALGHDARLLPAQFVKPFLKGQKNDYRDAEAIAEAVQRPTMRFVPVKTPLQLDLQAVHRVRSGLVARRTAVINQIRAMLFECGITVAQSARDLRACRGSARSRPRLWSRPLVMGISFAAAGTSRPGSVLFRANIPPEGERSCLGSQSGATPICGPCSFTGRAR